MKIAVSWSSGKDSAWMLHRLRQLHPESVVGLVTTVNAAVSRVAMHGVRQSLLEAQAAAAGLPLHVVPLPWPCSNDDYASRMSEAIGVMRRDGITHMAFGDLFLEDVRRYREERLAGTGIAPLFPLWQVADTASLAREMVAAGLEARLTCVDPRQLDADFAGRSFDATLLDALPATVDPCGERGEFHTFACAGPMFDRRIDVAAGPIVEREGFVYADLIETPA